MERNIPNLGQELVTPAPGSYHPIGIKQPVTTPKMPQLEPILPTPPPRYSDNHPPEKNRFPKQSHEFLAPTKLDPSNIGNLMPSVAKSEISSKPENRLSSKSTEAPKNVLQNPLIPFSNNKDDMESSSAPHRGASSNANDGDKVQDRQLKTVIPSPADPIEEQPSFQDIHDMVLFSKKKPSAKNPEKQSKIGKILFFYCKFYQA